MFLIDHTAGQWNSVYWNSDVIRPDRIVYLLNDDLKQVQNDSALLQHGQQQKKQHGRVQLAYDNSEQYLNDERNKTNRLSNKAASNFTKQNLVDSESSDKSQSHLHGQTSSNGRSQGHSSSWGLGIQALAAGFGGEGLLFSSSDKDTTANSKSRSN